jgi:hypothetical protein
LKSANSRSSARHRALHKLRRDRLANDPSLKHARYRHRREVAWAKQGIVEADGTPLRWETYEAVLAFQGGRCPICERVFFLHERRNACADHDHQFGVFRGILCGGKLGCNLRHVGAFERRGRLDNAPLTTEVERRVYGYITRSPYQKWLAQYHPELYALLNLPFDVDVHGKEVGVLRPEAAVDLLKAMWRP